MRAGDSAVMACLLIRTKGRAGHLPNSLGGAKQHGTARRVTF